MRLNSKYRWQGQLLGIVDHLVIGWAVGVDRRERAIIELTLDDIPIALGTADVFLPDLIAQGIGDGCHGFAMGIPALATQLGGRLRARFANRQRYLPGFLDLPTAAKPPSLILSSRVWYDGGLRLAGWARYSTKQQQTLTVHAYIEDTCVASATADGVEHGGGSFVLNVPTRWADGAGYLVRVVDAEGRALYGSPIAIQSWPQGLSAVLQQLRTTPLREAATWDLARALAAHYEARLPVSWDLTEYPLWFERFGQPETVPEVAAHFFIVVHGVGDKERTEASLTASSGVAWHIWTEADTVSLTAALEHQYHLHPDTLVLLVRAGDRVAPAALPLLAAAFTDAKVQAVYSDCDHDGPAGERTQPQFKPAWDPDLHLAQDYVEDLFACRLSLLTATALTHSLEIPWRVRSVASSGGIRHLPWVLCHRQPNVAARVCEEAAQRRSLAQTFLDQHEPGANALLLSEGTALRRIHRPLRERPLVSLLIPTRDQAELLELCVNTVLQRTRYNHFEVLIIDNQSREPRTLALFDKLRQDARVRVIPYAKAFNYSALHNWAIPQARGDIIGFLNNDTAVIHAGWLDELLILLLRPGIGAVGAKLLWINERVQHGGVILGINGLAGHVGNDLAATDPGYMHRSQVAHRYSAVTAACLLCRKADYERVGGLDEHAFPVAFNDVDLCLKLGSLGLAVVWTPFAQLYHWESVSRGQDQRREDAARAQMEQNQLRVRWSSVLLNDPAYHPSLSLDARTPPFSGLAVPPRPRNLR